MTKVLSIKQRVEPESTKVTRVTEGIKSEVSCIVREFGLERVNVLRRSSTVAPTRSTQPWFGARAGGLLPNFLTPGQRSWTNPGWWRLHEPSWRPLCRSHWPCDWVCCRTDRGFDPCNVASPTACVFHQLLTWRLDRKAALEFQMYWGCSYWSQRGWSYPQCCPSCLQHSGPGG